MMTLSSPHTTGSNTVSRLMLTLCAALIPGLLALIVFFSWGYLINAILATVTALAVEALILKIRKRPVLFFLKDGSALVTALLLACALPPLAPWWLIVLGTTLAILFGKHLFGGLGQNPFNPAMVAYALLLVSLPLLMTTRWAAVDQSADFGQTVTIIFQGGQTVLDGLTGATPLDDYKQSISRLTAEDVLVNPIYQTIGAVGWTPVNLAFLLGGLVLLGLRIITWHIPVSLLGSLALLSILIGSDADAFVPLSLHLLSGSTMLAAFFIATDPVSAATSNRGKLIYGAGIGALIYIIRTWGNYPDATAFAVLLMNFAAPLIDHYTRPRVYGHKAAVKGYKNEQD
ncbi:electron transport complex subunit RsxD [Reinekea blandensis]|uniref:Ion-translocating oxidoreductase complex subunit D n=1 Tax=Reinekea blandensis MED297 TaxID=314283 RepID=A4BH73_9GAMM|nr:electron transport complex subunit RsxD [Reinekea blandensis]EAR08572.1 predicted NADH:ubiquinone oxidoreductase, subunit RnfD [Reinekea sp. MED297] [Reinekea blandensis MED297]